ncbi:MAG TPA: hypothetical protein VFA41_13075 [Ktedonobacteraceae bacterium]|jgi:hypothetical protein|nr:hypothetical protein [Ktedonobacteraceae bacterium]
MSQVIPGDLSVEDYQIIQAHQLGTPFAVYRLKPGSIRFTRWTGIMMLSMDIIILL